MDLFDATSRSGADASAGGTSAGTEACEQDDTQSPRVTLPWVSRRDGRWIWWIREDWAALWENEDAPNWLDLEHDAHSECVKSNESRSVYRTLWQGRPIYVKLARPPRRWGRVQWCVLGSSARREHRVGQYAEAHGIPVVEIIARGESPVGVGAHGSLLVTTGLADAESLSRCWEQLNGTEGSCRRRRNLLIDRVARLIAHAHQSGFHHLDLHAGNILIQPRGKDDLRAVFVDLQNVRIARAVSRRAVLRNLAQIHQWFSIHANLTDRWRFLRRYLSWRSCYEGRTACSRPLNLDARAMVPLLEAVIRRHADRLYAKRDRVAMRSGRYYSRLRLGRGWSAHVFLSTKHAVSGSRASLLTLTVDQWRSLLEDPASWLKPPERRMILKNSATTKVWRAKLQATVPADVDVVCKQKTATRWSKKLLYPWRMSRSMRTWIMANALLNRRIPTARPLAVVERHRFGLLREDFLLTEYVEGAVDLDTLLMVTMRPMEQRRQRLLKLQLIDAIVEIMHKLTSRGFVHRDFKALNVLVQWRPAGQAEPRIVLVDLDGVERAGRRRSARGALRMMMRLNVSLDHCRRVTRTDRLRFLLRYLERTRRPDSAWRALWRDLERSSVKKRDTRRAHQQRKLRKHGRI